MSLASFQALSNISLFETLYPNSLADMSFANDEPPAIVAAPAISGAAYNKNLPTAAFIPSPVTFLGNNLPAAFPANS